MAAIGPGTEESGVFGFPKGNHYSLNISISIIIYSVWPRNLGGWESITMPLSSSYFVKLSLYNPYKILKCFWVDRGTKGLAVEAIVNSQASLQPL